MNRLILATVLLPGWCLGNTLAGAQAVAVHEGSADPLGHWTLERIELSDRRVLHGYIESEDSYWIHLVQIKRPTNRPMYLVIQPIKRDLVVAINRLDTPGRAVLRQRIDAFRNHARIETARADAIKLTLSTEGNQLFHRYDGQWFKLQTNVDEPTVRWMIVRLEQVFTAYRQVLPPRVKPSRPLQLKVYGSMTAYREFLARAAIRAPGPACFIAEDNLVVVGSRLNLLDAALAKIDERAGQLRANSTSSRTNSSGVSGKPARTIGSRGSRPR